MSKNQVRYNLLFANAKWLIVLIFTNYIARRAVPGEMKVSDEVKSPKRVGGQILYYNSKQRMLSLLEQPEVVYKFVFYSTNWGQ